MELPVELQRAELVVSPKPTFAQEGKRERKGLKPIRQVVNHTRVCTKCGKTDLLCQWSPEKECVA